MTLKLWIIKRGVKWNLLQLMNQKKSNTQTVQTKKNLYAFSSPLSKERHQNAFFACGANLCWGRVPARTAGGVEAGSRSTQDAKPPLHFIHSHPTLLQSDECRCKNDMVCTMQLHILCRVNAKLAESLRRPLISFPYPQATVHP